MTSKAKARAERWAAKLPAYLQPVFWKLYTEKRSAVNAFNAVVMVHPSNSWHEQQQKEDSK